MDARMENPQGTDESLDSSSTNRQVPRSSSTGPKVKTKTKGRGNRNIRNRNRNKQDPKSPKSGYSTYNLDIKSTSLVNLTSKSFMCSNLSTRTLITKYINSKSISESYVSIRDHTLYVNLTLNIFKDRLDAQANVWARRIVSMHELNLRTIVGRNSDKWETELEKCFVYSYFSAVLHALRIDLVADFSDDRYFIKGHYILNRFLTRKSFSFEHDGVKIVYKFFLNEEIYNEILKVAKQYDYINDHLSLFPILSLENEALERILSGLKQNIDPNGPSILCSKEDNIVESCLTKDNFPIGNSFYTDNHDQNSWSFSFNPDYNILDRTTLFGKACFLTRSKLDETFYYYDNNREQDDYRLVKNEVTTLCGSSYPIYVKKESLKVTEQTVETKLPDIERE